MIRKLGEDIDESELDFTFNFFNEAEEENNRADIYSLKLLKLALMKKKPAGTTNFYFAVYEIPCHANETGTYNILDPNETYFYVVLRIGNLRIKFKWKFQKN